MVGDKSIVIKLFSGFSVSHRYLKKVYQECVFPVPKGYILNRAVCEDLMFFPVKPVFNFCFRYSLDPPVEGFMGIRFTDKDEIEMLFEKSSAKRFMGVEVVSKIRYP